MLIISWLSDSSDAVSSIFTDESKQRTQKMKDYLGCFSSFSSTTTSNLSTKGPIKVPIKDTNKRFNQTQPKTQPAQQRISCKRQLHRTRYNMGHAEDLPTPGDTCSHSSAALCPGGHLNLLSAQSCSCFTFGAFLWGEVPWNGPAHFSLCL